jgi:hypothetical protein
MSFGTGNWLSEDHRVTLAGLGREISPRSLMEIVYDVVHRIAWPEWKHQAGAAPAPVLRTVLVYCYVVGTMSSEEIEAAGIHDPAVRYLCANHRLNWETIREFRRANQPILFEALSLTIERVLGGFASRARLFAAERLARAVQADSAAMDA